MSSSSLSAWFAYKERKKNEKWWRNLLTPDTAIDPPLDLIDTDELDFDDIPTMEYDWRK